MLDAFPDPLDVIWAWNCRRRALACTLVFTFSYCDYCGFAVRLQCLKVLIQLEKHKILNFERFKKGF